MKRVLTLLCLLPASLAGQEQREGTHFVFAGAGAQQYVTSHIAAATNRFTGLVLGGEGTLVSRSVLVRLRYGQGSVATKETSADPREVVEGEALVGFRVMPWLTLWAGPSAHAYTTSDLDQRWLLWTARAGARTSILPGRMNTFVELWGAISGNVSDPGGKAGGRGADAGLEMRFGAQSSFWGRLGYRIESAHADGLRETVEAVSLSLVYGLP